MRSVTVNVFCHFFGCGFVCLFFKSTSVHNRTKAAHLGTTPPHVLALMSFFGLLVSVARAEIALSLM